jgi:hypothetical protein
MNVTAWSAQRDKLSAGLEQAQRKSATRGRSRQQQTTQEPVNRTSRLQLSSKRQ